jgi:hypothetical protein
LSAKGPGLARPFGGKWIHASLLLVSLFVLIAASVAIGG